MAGFMLAIFLLALYAVGFAQEQAPIVISGKPKVAGRNPFFYCNDQDPYTLQIAYINISPPDPRGWVPGHNITIEIDGHNQQIIEDGAVVDIRIMKKDSMGTWRVLRDQRQDLCFGLNNLLDAACPVRSGVSTESRNFSLPRTTQPGLYYLVIDAHTRFNERITCVQAAVTI
ncbi:hypothetical protein BX600DRAFT_439904 [Xylariales sp. PMI_506]|nr:hypothetical protein BX600DRAFT_439904 [Xylariales sp. PMI_506]